MQLELTQLKQDTERRLAEKDEEMEAQRYKEYTYSFNIVVIFVQEKFPASIGCHATERG